MIEIPSPKPIYTCTLDQHVILNFKIRLDFTRESLGGCGWRMAMWQCAKYLHLENIKISKELCSLKLLKLTFQLYSNIELSQGGRQDPSWISCYIRIVWVTSYATYFSDLKTTWLPDLNFRNQSLYTNWFLSNLDGLLPTLSYRFPLALLCNITFLCQIWKPCMAAREMAILNFEHGCKVCYRNISQQLLDGMCFNILYTDSPWDA